MNAYQTQHATPMEYVTTQKDLIHAYVILDTAVMDLLAKVCTEIVIIISVGRTRNQV